MNNKILTRVALRYRAVFLDIKREDINMRSETSAPVIAFTKRLKETGFCVSEELLHALNAVSVDRLAEITECINDVMGVKLNWAPLVKGWDVPTGESLADHLITLIANIFGKKAGFKGIKWMIAGIAAIFLAANSFTIVPAGHTGVVLTLGEVSSNPLSDTPVSCWTSSLQSE